MFIGNDIAVKGYILPHKNNFSSETAYKNAEGVYGFSAHQGFYVYRGNRLLLAGDWLGLMRKEESYKLVRIQVDLQNTVDSDWQIDIKNQKHILQWVVGYSWSHMPKGHVDWE